MQTGRLWHGALPRSRPCPIGAGLNRASLVPPLAITTLGNSSSSCTLRGPRRQLRQWAVHAAPPAGPSPAPAPPGALSSAAAADSSELDGHIVFEVPSAVGEASASAAAASASQNNIVAAPADLLHQLNSASTTSAPGTAQAQGATSEPPALDDPDSSMSSLAATTTTTTTPAPTTTTTTSASQPPPQPPQEPFSLVKSVPLAGGQLDIVCWKGERMLRIWTPPGYTRSDAAHEPYPVLYLNDGQNLFDERLSLSGASWHAAEAAEEAISGGLLPPFVIVGMDHSGATRSYDYLPYPPGTANGFRLDAEKWPGGGVDAYLQAVVQEILPYAEKAYGVSSDPALRAFGGSSFGGICALCCAVRHPGVFGGLLVESPSLWFGEERMLREELPAYGGPWPQRVYLAMGTEEYSGIRSGKGSTFDDLLVDYTHELAELLEAQGVTRGSRLQVEVEEGATHTESAWAGRLPRALAHLGLPWWRPLLARRAAQGALYFTVPRKPKAGARAVVYFNPTRSATLSSTPYDKLQLSYGFNVHWSVGAGKTQMVPAVGVSLLRRQAEEEAAERRRLQEEQLREEAKAAAAAAAASAAAAAATATVGTAAKGTGTTAEEEREKADAAAEAAMKGGKAESAAGAGTGPAIAAVDVQVQVQVHVPEQPIEEYLTAPWLQASLTVPPEAYELHMAFSDGGGTWDNNAGANFYARVRMGMSADQLAATVDKAVQEGASWGNVQDIAHRRGGSKYFTTPEVLLAGEPAVLYVNRRRCVGLEENPNLRLHLGFNGWSTGGQELHLKPTSLWRGEDIDWWCTPVTVPADATDLQFVLTDGHGIWDNNRGNNYVLPVKARRPAGGKEKEEQKEQRPLREVESVESTPHGAGTLHILTLAKRQGGSRASKWTEEKRLRVWTPPGFDAANPPPGGYPVLYMNDGQNMFEDWLAHQGVSWRVGYTASDLITRGELPPFVVVAVDSAGAMRSLNYLPYPPGSGAGGFRGDAERWPGGGLEAYMGRLVEELMPLVQARYSVSSDPAKVAFGGGSFAGVAALYAALHYPHVFGAVLVESPSLWVAEGRFLQDMRVHRGMLPARLFLGCGTREYSATRDHVREDVDGLLLGYCHEAARILEEQGMAGGRLRFLVEEGAGHHELAWQWRLTGALRFVCGPWWDE